jgi:hypothetical protein
LSYKTEAWCTADDAINSRRGMRAVAKGDAKRSLLAKRGFGYYRH